MFIGDTPTSLEVLSRVCRNAADLQLGPPATSNTYVVSATKAHCSSGLGLLLGRGCAAVLVTLRGTNTALAPCVGIARAGPSRLLARDGGPGDSPALSGGLAGITGGRARAGGVFAGDSQGTAFKLLDVSACSLCGDSSLLLESHPPLSFALGGPYRGEWEMASGLVLGSRRLGGGETGAAAGVSFSFLRRGLAGESLDCGADLAGGGFVRGVTLQSKEMSVSSSTSGSSGSAHSCSSLAAPLGDGAGTTVSSFCTGLVLRWLDLVGPGTRGFRCLGGVSTPKALCDATPGPGSDSHSDSSHEEVEEKETADEAGEAGSTWVWWMGAGVGPQQGTTPAPAQQAQVRGSACCAA
eukprot:CAMPEP_0114289712 /NCGR_PEP_ID=MMETSP0059-20121206/7529_1 /TAXON_ID=36894 /ORGANISM="Pyramimonas parkeae, Strain CCMP726" /LENGTH=352 /DNA_ID=CAMNT_0001411021 /DNA_START=324 /DNA_END=1380 /DNA_ORIENTATION=+